MAVNFKQESGDWVSLAKSRRQKNGGGGGGGGQIAEASNTCRRRKKGDGASVGGELSGVPHTAGPGCLVSRQIHRRPAESSPFGWKHFDNIPAGICIDCGVTGACSVFLGFAHLRVWNNVSLATAATSATISMALTALAFGLVCKQITMGGHRGKRLQTLEAFIAISGVTQLLYLLLLHAGMFSSRYGPAYNG
ncbi:Membrane protein PM19L [Sesamum alatum]|uniref:Membrane protein PM19L n=1 Tax=Sesamum alatum TaxID=300844 RepID=A0AAE2CBZ8_9LAMI|nr:Membrane protein PM19L [Sesamum alatum]